MPTLSQAARAEDTFLSVDDVSGLSLDGIYALDDEMVVIRGKPSVGARLLVGRGHLGTPRASHAGGTSLVAYSATSPGGGSISATDGTTTVNPATSIQFPAGTLADAGGGVASAGLTSSVELLALGNVTVGGHGEVVDLGGDLMVGLLTLRAQNNTGAGDVFYVTLAAGSDPSVDGDGFMSNYLNIVGPQMLDAVFSLTGQPFLWQNTNSGGVDAVIPAVLPRYVQVQWGFGSDPGDGTITEVSFRGIVAGIAA